MGKENKPAPLGNTIFLVDPGTLTDIVFPKFNALLPILDSQDESNKNLTKESLQSIAKLYLHIKQIYQNMILAQSNPTVKIIEISIAFTSGKTLNSLVEVKEHLQELFNGALEHIGFLRSIYKTLLEKGNFSQAATEMRFIHEHAQKILGPNHFETITALMDLGIAGLRTDIHDDQAYEALHGATQKLQSQLDNDAESPEKLKRAAAIGCYSLAQFFQQKGEHSNALQWLNISEQLRKSYQANESELDKIRFMRGQIACIDNRFEESESLLTASYIFRKSLNKNIHLLSVLDTLIFVKDRLKRDAGEQAILLGELLQLKIDLQLDAREVISTRLQLLKKMSPSVSDDEYWTVLKQVQQEMGTIVITSADTKVLQMYISLADSQLTTFLPQAWPNVQKRKFYCEVLTIIIKAKNHADQTKNNSIKEYLENLNERCVFLIEAFSDFAAYRLIGEELHPEDQAALAEEQQTNVVDEDRETEIELFELSDFSSEVQYTEIAAENISLTVEEFLTIAPEGHINPWRLRTAQGGINPDFREENRSLSSLRNALIIDPSYTNRVPPIEIGVHEGKVYSFDTRRLLVHQQAKEVNPNVSIRYNKIEGDRLQDRIDRIFSSRPWNGYVTAERYGGVNSESKPYINPAVRSQLENSVNNAFRCFPNQREDGDDNNGFPVRQKQAHKIFQFLVQKKAEGSQYARETLARMREISRNEGREPAYAFLINQKQMAANIDRPGPPVPRESGRVSLE
jgi:hypothetical protein